MYDVYQYYTDLSNPCFNRSCTIQLFTITGSVWSFLTHTRTRCLFCAFTWAGWSWIRRANGKPRRQENPSFGVVQQLFDYEERRVSSHLAVITVLSASVARTELHSSSWLEPELSSVTTAALTHTVHHFSLRLKNQINNKANIALGSYKNNACVCTEINIITHNLV